MFSQALGFGMVATVVSSPNHAVITGASSMTPCIVSTASGKGASVPKILYAWYGSCSSKPIFEAPYVGCCMDHSISAIEIQYAINPKFGIKQIVRADGPPVINFPGEKVHQTQPLFRPECVNFVLALVFLFVFLHIQSDLVESVENINLTRVCEGRNGSRGCRDMTCEARTVVATGEKSIRM